MALIGQVDHKRPTDQAGQIEGFDISYFIGKAPDPGSPVVEPFSLMARESPKDLV